MTGGCHAHNVSASLITTISPDGQWIADTPTKYENLAVAAVSDPTKLAQIRAGLRDKMLTSPMCDATAFMRKLEGSYQKMWHTWVKGGSMCNSGVSGGVSVEDSADLLTSSLQDTTLQDVKVTKEDQLVQHVEGTNGE